MSRDSLFLFYSGPFSQWHMADFLVENIVFRCAEQYMMYNKALLFNDMETASKILQAKKPAEHKALGREIRNFDEGRWCFFREGIVYTGNYHKFSQNPSLKQTLLDTGNTFITG